ncbi:MAG: competence/damage-inducible protein A [Clostridia bacterium]|jgi:nicotinamide-nucleotide amidase
MIAEILSVGTELLMGQILNSNTQYISSRLPEAGICVYFQSVVGDNPKRLKSALDIALSRSDLVIMTGGLGPTQDDLTKETVAAAMGRKLVVHPETLKRIEDHFRKVNKEMVESNKKQAFLPDNSKIIENSNGTAPGCIIEEDGKTIIMLPGPPKEMIPMFDDTVMPYLKDKSDIQIVSKFIKIFGLGESFVETKVEDLIAKSSNPTIATYAKDGEVTVRVTAQVSNGEDASLLLNPIIDEFEKRFGKNIYSTDNLNLEQVVGDLLIRNNITLSIAESCTGGLLSSLITDVPGISKIFMGSIVCYSNDSKINFLNVSRNTISNFGAVSRESAVEMAIGAKEKFNTDIGVSITGIAGPAGATEDKPVGLVYIALTDSSSLDIRELNLIGDRQKIRKLSAMNSLDMIRLWILKHY